MDISGLLSQLQSSGAIDQISQQHGISTESAMSAVSSLLPALMGGAAQQATTDDGSGLNNLLDQHGDGSAMNDLSGFVGNLLSGGGNPHGASIVSSLLGDQHQEVTNATAAHTGLDAGTVSSILMTIAPIALQYLGSQRNNSAGGGLNIASLASAFLGGNNGAQGGGGLDVGSLLNIGRSLLGK